VACCSWSESSLGGAQAGGELRVERANGDAAKYCEHLTTIVR
jgi:hypothetical protein